MSKIFVTKPSLPPYEEYTEEIRSIWETEHITNFGPEYEKFIDLLKKRYGYKNLDIQCNGHMTLQNILSCIPKGEIITTPFTFVSTTLAIINSGHTPVFCDINPTDYNLDADKIEPLINENTVAIVPVHVYGSPCDVEAIQKIADRHKLKIVYDAAHAFDVSVGNVPIGTFGDASMFSFHATKVFNSIEGGMGVFNDESLLSQVKSRSNFGTSDGLCIYDGVNSKMNEFQAAMGVVNLNHLDSDIKKRKAVCGIYDRELSGISALKLLKRRSDVNYNYAYYPILINHPVLSADGLLRYLSEHDIYAKRYFYPAVNEMPLIKDSSMEQYATPIASKVSQNILCLPLYADLVESDVLKICNLVKEYFGNEQ